MTVKSPLNNHEKSTEFTVRPWLMNDFIPLWWSPTFERPRGRIVGSHEVISSRSKQIWIYIYLWLYMCIFIYMIYIYMYGGFLEWGTQIAGWFIMEKLIYNGWFGGTSIFSVTPMDWKPPHGPQIGCYQITALYPEYSNEIISLVRLPGLTKGLRFIGRVCWTQASDGSPV